MGLFKYDENDRDPRELSKEFKLHILSSHIRMISKYRYSYMPSKPIGTASVIIGGYDPNQFRYNLTWMDVPVSKNAWNTTVTQLIYNSTTIYNSSTQTFPTTAKFETGYKYLGAPTSAWSSFCAQLQQTNPTRMVACFVSNNVRPNSFGVCGTDFNNNYNVTIRFNTTAVFNIPSAAF
jgi:hypothetical protein